MLKIEMELYQFIFKLLGDEEVGSIIRVNSKLDSKIIPATKVIHLPFLLLSWLGDWNRKISYLHLECELHFITVAVLLIIFELVFNFLTLVSFFR